jgi:hypothetical protein
MTQKKAEPAGYDARRALLEPVFGLTLPERDRIRAWVALHRLDSGASRGLRRMMCWTRWWAPGPPADFLKVGPSDFQPSKNETNWG